MRSVVGAEHIEKAGRRGRRFIEILPGSIVTDQARETAQRLGVALRQGPLERPAVPVVDGNAALYRVLYRRSPKWMPPAPPQGRQPRKLQRIAIVGTGGVGANLAQIIVSSDASSELVLVDVAPGLAESLALDMRHASGISRSACRVQGGVNASLVAGSDVIVVTAGRARTPGMARTDLLSVNRRVIRGLGEVIRTAAPDSVVLVVTNPVDEMTAEMMDATGFPRERVLGMAGTLDSARFRAELARTAGVATAEVEAMVVGNHGDGMTALASHARIRGFPAERYLGPEDIAACKRRTTTAGGEVVALRRTGSASVAPAYAIAELIDHMRGARVGPVPVTVMMEGEYGIEGMPLGVPCHLGIRGLIEVAELGIDADELDQLRRAADLIRQHLRN